MLPNPAFPPGFSAGRLAATASVGAAAALLVAALQPIPAVAAVVLSVLTVKTGAFLMGPLPGVGVAAATTVLQGLLFARLYGPGDWSAAPGAWAVLLLANLAIALATGFLSRIWDTYRRQARTLRDEAALRSRAEAELVRERDRTRQVLDALGQGVAVADEQGRFEYVNPAFARFLATTPDALLGRSTAEFTLAEDRPLLKAQREQRNRGVEGSYQTRLRREDGSEMVAYITATPRWEDGRVTGSIAAISNITARTQMEKALLQSEERFRAIASATTEAILFWDGVHIVDANDAVTRLFGYSRDALTTLAITDLVAPADHEAVLAAQRELRSHAYEVTCLRADGTGFPAELQGSTVPYPERRVRATIIRCLVERKQAQADLAASEQRFRHIVEAAGDIIFRTDLEGHFTYVNPVAARTMGVAAADLLGRSFLSLVRPDYRELTLALYRRQVGEQTTATYWEFPAVTPAGSTLWIGQNVQLVYEKGQLTGMQAVARDVTERVQAEEALRQSNELLSALITSSPVAIMALNRHGKTTLWNPASEQLFGWTAAEVLGRPLPLVPPDKEEEHRHLRERVFSGVMLNGVEAKRVCKDGRSVDVSISTALLHDEAGEVSGVMAVVQDITERRQAEAALRESEARFRDLFESAGDLIQSVHPDGTFEYVNRAWLRALGYSADEVAGLRLWDVIAPEEREHCRALLQRILAGDEVNPVHTSFISKFGRRIEVEGGVSVAAGDQGVAATRAIFRDVTERRIVERIKDEFVSVVSHELRTPLTSIRGSLGLLASGLLQSQPEKAQRLLQIAVGNADRLIRLINDILDIERLEAGKAPMELRETSGGELVQQALNGAQGMAGAANVRLRLEDAAAGGTPLHADVDRVVQVLLNLLSNAIKFAPPDSVVTISLTREGDSLQFSVSDHGRGIPPDKLESIFDRFQQVNASDSRQKGGTGLGLAISREIVRQHGGAIWAESDGRSGSTFRFTLPARRAEYPAEGEAPSETRDGRLRLLLVEDDTDLIRVFSEWATHQGVELLYAQSGRDGVHMATTYLPDALVLDVGLPDGDGYAVVEALRKVESLAELPVVVYSAREFSDAEKQRLRLGRTLFFTKSRVAPEAFEQELLRLLRRIPTRPVEGAPTA